MKAEEELLWKLYTRNKTTEIRDRLIDYYYPYIQSIARRLMRTLPAFVDVNDLVAVGVIGLMDAIPRFDPCRNLTFRSYATSRIKGAMLDELRREDWMSIYRRRLKTFINRSREALRHRLGREPTSSEITTLTGIHEKKLHYAEMRQAPEDESFDEIIDLHAEGPEEKLFFEDLFHFLQRCGFRERDCTLLRMRYIENLTSEQVAGTLNIAQRQVNAINKEIMTFLYYMSPRILGQRI